MSTLTVNNISLHYEMSGQGQALVFIHGLGSSTKDWENQIPVFAEKYQVIAFDLRGHGQSDKPEGPYAIPMFASDLAELLDALKIDAAHVVGISLGGGVAFQFALDYPKHVKSLTIVNSAPTLGGTPEQAKQEIDRRVGIVQQFGMKAMGQSLAPALFPDPNHGSPRETFVERWSANDPKAYIEATRSMLGWDVTEQLPKIQCPVLILAADQDYGPVAAKEAYAKLLPNVKLQVIPNSHHAVPIERPEEFNRVLSRFLDSLKIS